MGGHRFDNYLDWMATCFAITLTACPAISIPAGFTAGGLPVGLQVVGRPRGEAALLAASHLFEQALGVADQTPDRSAGGRLHLNGTRCRAQPRSRTGGAANPRPMDGPDRLV